jgi:hypothetical protein
MFWKEWLNAFYGKKSIVQVAPEPFNNELEATTGKRNFEVIDDGQWQWALEESFAEMKRQGCRRRLLPHLPAIRKPAINRSTTVAPKQAGNTHSSGNNRTRRRLDSRLLGRLCFRKIELEMLFNARADWD